MKSVAKQISKKSNSIRKGSPARSGRVAPPAHRPAVAKQPAAKQAAARPAAVKPSHKPAPPAPVVAKAPLKARALPAAVIPLNGRPLPLASVPTNGKPRKNQAGLTSRELETFRALLLDKRRQLVGDVSSMERDALSSGGGTNLSNLPLHMADMGTDNYEQEFTIGLMEKDRKLLKEINRALAKIQDGSYGICEGTGQPISKVRLEAQPWARFSIDYARKLEHGGVGRINPD